MTLKEFRVECEVNKVPIIRELTQELLIEKIGKIKPEKILELGMAVGYSSTLWGVHFNCKITCVELDSKNIPIAKKNHAKFGVLNIDIINEDAKLFKTNEKYDVIFIDAGKSWYLEYYNMFKDNLTEKGLIIFDNVNYHGLLKTNLRKHRTIVRKMNNFHNFINNEQTTFKYKWYDIDDGILILGNDEKSL